MEDTHIRDRMWGGGIALFGMPSRRQPASRRPSARNSYTWVACSLCSRLFSPFRAAVDEMCYASTSSDQMHTHTVSRKNAGAWHLREERALASVLPANSDRKLFATKKRPLIYLM